MKYGIIICSFLLYISSLLVAQDNFEQQTYFKSFMCSAEGLICTDNYNSALYLVKNGSAKKIFSADNCGNYYSLSPDRRLLGFKTFGSGLIQTPCLFDLASNSLIQLALPAEKCGQPAFAADGTVSFTIDCLLHVKHPDGKEQTFDLGYYCNLAPISPDGRYAAFNDADDQLKIISLQSSQTFSITDKKQGYFNPQWSPDASLLAYNSLAGELFVYDLNNQATYKLGQGFSPRWMQDSRSIVFYRKNISDMQLVNSDIYASSYQGNNICRLTTTDDICEIDPVCSEDGSLYFGSLKTGEIFYSALKNFSSPVTSYISLVNSKPEVEYFPRQDAKSIKSAMDIPYVNQVYDTPDWFNGRSACGPTSAIMSIAYYNLLPKWDGYCSTPSAHYNSWGRYVSDKYRFKAMFYALSANDPNGTAAYGGFGYMWSSGSPHTRMSYYFNNHGFTSTISDNPAHSTALSEIGATYPYTLCVGLTSSGHIIVMHGLGTEQHTVVTNDPYGDKNKPGYPNYYGKNAMYDWPGYSNGYQNLSTVYWAATTHYTAPPPADTIVDDLQFQKEFYLNTKAPASMSTWLDLTGGYKNHYWYCYSRNSAVDTCYAEWRPSLSRDGYYEVSAFIPTAVLNSVKYKIYHYDGSSTIEANQSLVNSDWMPLGRFNFAHGNTGYVKLGDASNEAGNYILFDAVKWSYLGPMVDVSDEKYSRPADFRLEQNYPNPFNPATSISYSLPAPCHVNLSVFDLTGSKICELINGPIEAGTHSVTFNAAGFHSGVYFYTLRAGSFTATRKLTLIK